MDEISSFEKKNSIIEKPAPKLAQKNESPAESDIEIEEINENDDFIEHELAKKIKKEEKFVPSDQVTMVMKLFDGKYID